jgi:hypothetical protein
MFPFLDALICTMGALLVLLHAFASHDQTNVKKAVAARQEAQRLEEQDQIEFHQWRSGHLTEARAKTQAQLADARLRLAHIEDHQRRLEAKFRQLQIAAKELEKAGSEKTAEKEQNTAALAELNEKLAKARVAVDEARKKGNSQAVNYSVIPFEGRNSTQRRPIYIECRENQIILQPEGVQLTPRDFIGFFGPGNPLASALRAQSEYFATQAPPGKAAEEPYPLLLVRPDGIAAYYAARAALDSWGNEFGYELVGADWNLTFPERDPLLADLTERVVGEARQRQREYILSSPQVARRRPRPVYHAKSHGGFEKDQGTGDGPDGSGLGAWGDSSRGWGEHGDEGFGNDGSAGRSGGRGGNSALAEGDAGLGDPMAEYGAFGQTLEGTPDTEPGSVGPRLRSQGSESGTAGRGNSSMGEYSQTGRGPAGGPSREHGVLTQRGPYGQTPGSTEGVGGPGGQGSSGKEQSGGESGTAKLGQASQQAGAPGSSFISGVPGGAQAPTHAQAPDSTAHDMARGNSLAGDRSSTANQYGSDSMSNGNPAASSMSAHVSKAKSMATARGKDWGLSGSGVGAVAASRPILVQCYPNRLVLVPESRNQLAKQIPLSENTQDSMDDFVSSVWDYMKVWGKAGRGLYWRPTLVVDVAPGGEARFADIQALLANSGLDVSRRNAPAVTRQPAAAANRR